MTDLMEFRWSLHHNESEPTVFKIRVEFKVLKEEYKPHEMAGFFHKLTDAISEVIRNHGVKV